MTRWTEADIIEAPEKPEPAKGKRGKGKKDKTNEPPRALPGGEWANVT